MNQQNELKTHNSRLTTYNAKLLFSYVPYSLHFLEHHCHVWAEFVCAPLLVGHPLCGQPAAGGYHNRVVVRAEDNMSSRLKETEFEMSGNHYDEKNARIGIVLEKAIGRL